LHPLVPGTVSGPPRARSCKAQLLPGAVSSLVPGVYSRVWTPGARCGVFPCASSDIRAPGQQDECRMARLVPGIVFDSPLAISSVWFYYF
jgi:hypothetical protein